MSGLWPLADGGEREPQAFLPASETAARPPLSAAQVIQLLGHHGFEELPLPEQLREVAG